VYSTNVTNRDKGAPPKLAITCLEEAIELARRQGSRLLELRATMSLARIVTHKAGPSQVLGRLSTIFRTFSEGLTTADLLEAKALLADAALL
jgi:hypothetical protein